MIVRAVSDETLIRTQKYVLMIVTESIFNYLIRVYHSIHAFLSRDAKEMNKINFVHIFNLYSTAVYRFGRNDYRLDITAVIAYNNSYNRHNGRPFQKDLTMSCKYLDIYK